MPSPPPYNPLDKLNLGKSVAEALLTEGVSSMSDIADIAGAGVYAIYYTGGFPAYAPLAAQNVNGQFKQPIYVGKAIPKGGRKGGLVADAAKGRALRDRLKHHAKNIRQAENLDINDFYFRSLVVDDIWIPLGENMLIEAFQPVWNRVIDGFGNNDPGTRRATQYRSPWDVLHPGREFAVKLADGGITAEALTAKLADFFRGKPVPLVEDDDGQES
jgi:hypothetical protein